MRGSILLTLVCGCAILATLAHLGCGSPRRDVPYTEPVALDDEQVRRGQIAFMQQCNQCHPGGAAGLGPAINDKPLPQFLIRTQIRRGLGAMPAFDEKHISDGDVEAIAAYLKSLREADERVASR